MTTTTTDEQARDAVTAAGRAWRTAATKEERLRAERDAAIREASSAGMGVREIARLTSLDPTQVSRVLAR